MIPKSFIIELKFLKLSPYLILFFHLQSFLFFILVTNSCIASMLLPLYHAQPAKLVSTSALHTIASLIFSIGLRHQGQLLVFPKIQDMLLESLLFLNCHFSTNQHGAGKCCYSPHFRQNFSPHLHIALHESTPERDSMAY